MPNANQNLPIQNVQVTNPTSIGNPYQTHQANELRYQQAYQPPTLSPIVDPYRGQPITHGGIQLNQSYQPISQPYFQGQCQEPAYAPTSLEPQRECQPQTIQYLDPLAFKELQKNVEELKNEIKKKSSSSTGKKLGFYDFTKKEEKERSPFPVRAPKFVPYDGTTDPQHHLVSFCNKCRAIADNDSMLINYF